MNELRRKKECRPPSAKTPPNKKNSPSTQVPPRLSTGLSAVPSVIDHERFKEGNLGSLVDLDPDWVRSAKTFPNKKKTPELMARLAFFDRLQNEMFSARQIISEQKNLTNRICSRTSVSPDRYKVLDERLAFADGNLKIAAYQVQTDIRSCVLSLREAERAIREALELCAQYVQQDQTLNSRAEDEEFHKCLMSAYPEVVAKCAPVNDADIAKSLQSLWSVLGSIKSFHICTIERLDKLSKNFSILTNEAGTLHDALADESKMKKKPARRSTSMPTFLSRTATNASQKNQFSPKSATRPESLAGSATNNIAKKILKLGPDVQDLLQRLQSVTKNTQDREMVDGLLKLAIPYIDAASVKCHGDPEGLIEALTNVGQVIKQINETIDENPSWGEDPSDESSSAYGLIRDLEKDGVKLQVFIEDLKQDALQLAVQLQNAGSQTNSASKSKRPSGPRGIASISDKSLKSPSMPVLNSPRTKNTRVHRDLSPVPVQPLRNGFASSSRLDVKSRLHQIALNIADPSVSRESAEISISIMRASGKAVENIIQGVRELEKSVGKCLNNIPPTANNDLFLGAARDSLKMLKLELGIAGAKDRHELDGITQNLLDALDRLQKGRAALRGIQSFKVSGRQRTESDLIENVDDPMSRLMEDVGSFESAIRHLIRKAETTASRAMADETETIRKDLFNGRSASGMQPSKKQSGARKIRTPVPATATGSPRRRATRPRIVVPELTDSLPANSPRRSLNEARRNIFAEFDAILRRYQDTDTTLTSQ